MSSSSMLTIKHEKKGESERIVVVASVSYDAKKDVLTGHLADGSVFVTFNSGRAFVMNDNGKTIGIYNLGKD